MREWELVGGLTVPELLLCLHGHFNVRHGEGRKPQAFALSSRSSRVTRRRAGCRKSRTKAKKNGESWFGTGCSARNDPRLDVFWGLFFVLGGLEVSRGRVCAAADTNKVGDSIWSNLTAPAGEAARGTANTAQPDSQPTCESSQWAPGAGAKCGEKESSHTDPAATQSRFGSRFEYVWPSFCPSSLLNPSRVLATGKPSRLLALMAFRNRLSLKEGGFWAGLLCRSSLHTYICTT